MPRGRLLQLEEEARVLELDEVVDVLEPALHHVELGLDGIVPEGNLMLDNLLRRADEVAGHELHELVLHVLNKVEAGVHVMLHDKDGKVRVGLLDAVVKLQRRGAKRRKR